MGNNDIVRTSVFDPKTGDSIFSYSYAGQVCPAEYIESPIANQYIGYDLIFHDLELARLWLSMAYKLIDAAPEHRPDVKQNDDVFLAKLAGTENEALQALFVSSITYYGKCYTGAKGRRIKLESTNLPEVYLSIHDKIMEFRNTIAAHSGKGPWDTGRLALIAHPDGNYKSTVLWSELKTLQFFDDRNEEFSYLKLVDYLKVTTYEKMCKLREVILEKIK